MGTVEPAEYGEKAQRYVRAQIRAEIGFRGWSDAEVARRAGMHTSTLSRYLNDKNGTGIPYYALARMAYALGMDVRTLVARAEGRMFEETREADPPDGGTGLSENAPAAF